MGGGLWGRGVPCQALNVGRLTGRPPLNYSSHHSSCLPPLDQTSRGLIILHDHGRGPGSAWRRQLLLMEGRSLLPTVGPSF